MATRDRTPPARPPVSDTKQERSAATRRRLLSAAVDELVEYGYNNFTTTSVAERAGISRGAQQHHFPHKATLMAEAVGWLVERHLREVGWGTPGEPPETIVDKLYRAYASPLLVAMLDLSIAARHDAELHPVVIAYERSLSRATVTQAARWFGPEIAGHPDFSHRLAMTMATVRGYAMMELFGRDATDFPERWTVIRAELVTLLTRP